MCLKNTVFEGLPSDEKATQPGQLCWRPVSLFPKKDAGNWSFHSPVDQQAASESSST